MNDINFLYTFDRCGKFTIRSDRFNEIATVFVYPDDVIRNQSTSIFSCSFITIDFIIFRKTSGKASINRRY